MSIFSILSLFSSPICDILAPDTLFLTAIAKPVASSLISALLESAM